MKFKTRFDKHERYYSNSGNPYHIEYALQLDENGVEELVPVGKTYIPDEINSHADSVDIHTIMARFANGEAEVLTQRAGQYFDATGMPSNLAEMYRTVANGEYMFNQLPVEVRAEFNHSFSEFVSSIGTEKFNNVMSPKTETIIDKKDGESIES